MGFSKITVLLLLLSSLAFGQPQVDYFDVQPNPVYMDSVAEFTIEASGDEGIESIYLVESGGIPRECECDGSTRCSSLACRCLNESCFRRAFNLTGSYEFCAYAEDVNGVRSDEVCINVDVISVSECEPISMDDSSAEIQIAARIKTRRIKKEIHGFDGYPLDCCPYCEEILVNNSNCLMLAGSRALDYTVIYYNHSDNGTYGGLRFPKNIVNITPNPLVLCSAVVNENQTVLGVVDVVEFHLLESVHNDERMKHWFIETGKKLTGEGWDAIKIEALKEAASGFVNISIDAGNRVGLVSFNQEAYIDSYLTSDKDELNNEIRAYSASGVTDMEAAIRRGVEVLGAGGGVMVFMSDGKNTVLTDPIAAADDAKAAGVVIHTIALGNDADKATLKKIASITGGGFYEVTCDKSLRSIYEELADNLGDAVLVSDISESMGDPQHIDCYVDGERYFVADQMFSNETETKEYIIVSSSAYSSVVNKLMANECYHKQPESGECHFDCPDFDPRCHWSCLCNAGLAEGCCPCPPKTCECCPQCHQVYDYVDCFYRKYEKIYGRPYVDYLYCWKTPLKDTGWCKQRMDMPSSVINYPWYAMSAEEDRVSPRELDEMPQDYIDDLHVWNEMQEVKEMPVTEIAKRLWTPEAYCHHEYDPKLFRSMWAKIFTPTPHLQDERNKMQWSRTGEGAIYAGSGFRREPACWWECCRRCAPFCNCNCPLAGCVGLCCLNAFFSKGVYEAMEIIIPDTDITTTSMTVTQISAKQVEMSNGALKIIATGNMPFTVSGVGFSIVAPGYYFFTATYNPSSDYNQFVIVEDIVFNYTLREEAEEFKATLKETYSTELTDILCVCCPLTCSCKGDGVVIVPTTESVVDFWGESMVDIDTIKIEALKTGADDFIDIALGRGVEVGLVAFSSDYAPGWIGCSGGICSSYPITDDAGELHKQVATYTSGGNTCPSAGIKKAREMFAGITGEKHMIVMSDGVPNSCATAGCLYTCSEPTAENEAYVQAQIACDNNISVHTIALGDDAHPEIMAKMAKCGKTYNVTCECPLDCIYRELAGEVVEGNAILVSDVSGSMKNPLTLECPGKGIPVTHKNILRDININITGRIDNEVDKLITHEGVLRINVEPDIISGFVLNVGNESLTYSSLLYPVRHRLWGKEYGHGQWIPGIPYTVGTTVRYGRLPGIKEYRIDDSYGYEGEIPTAVGFEFPYPSQGKKICPVECFCPAYDLTDVTCVNYSTDPPTRYKRDDCICGELSQRFERPITSARTYHDEEAYYYDFTGFYSVEAEGELGVMEGKTKEKPVPPVGGLSGTVGHNAEITRVPTYHIYIANAFEDTVSKVRTVDCVQECKYYVEDNPSRTAVSLSKEVWVGNRNSNSVSRLDAASCNTLEHIRVGKGPRGIVVDELNNLWVGCKDDNTVWKFDGTSGECLVGDPGSNPSCPTGSSPIPVGVGDAAGAYGGVADCRGYVWMLSVKENSLYRINIHTNSEEGKYKIDRPPWYTPAEGAGYTYGINIDSNGDIWVGGGGSGAIHKIRGTDGGAGTGTLMCQRQVGGYTRGVAVDMENNVWAADYTGEVVVKINNTNCEPIGTYPVDGMPIGVAVDFDGYVWTVSQNTDTATKLDPSTGRKKCTAKVGRGPYCYSDMTGFNLWHTCMNKTFNATMVTIESRGTYVLNFTALPFPKKLTKEDFENASLTLFIHFRDNISNQTFPLFPTMNISTQPKNRSFYLNISMRDATRVIIEKVEPGRYNLNPGTDLTVSFKLINAFTGEGVPSENIVVTADAYGISQTVTTDETGKAEFSFRIGDYSTKIDFAYSGSNSFIESEVSDYYDVVSLSRVWWLISPEVLLLLIVLVMLAFAYRWFRGRRLGVDELIKELRGEE